jgi:hypothetical protein
LPNEGIRCSGSIQVKREVPAPASKTNQLCGPKFLHIVTIETAR